MVDPGRHTRAYPFPLSLFTSFILFRVLQYLTRIPHFRYSPRSHISGTHPDSPFLVLARIPPSRYSLESHISDTRPNPTYSGTHPDFYFFGTRPDPTFPVPTRIQPFPVLAWTLLRSLPGFPHLLRHRPWISLSFPALCSNHSSSQASYLVFFKPFNRSDFVLLTFSTR